MGVCPSNAWYTAGRRTIMDRYYTQEEYDKLKKENEINISGDLIDEIEKAINDQINEAERRNL